MNNLTKVGTVTVFTTPHFELFFTDKTNYKKEGMTYFICHQGKEYRFDHKNTTIAGTEYTEVNFRTQLITAEMFQ